MEGVVADDAAGAIAAASGIPGTSQRATTATAATVSPTGMSTRLVTARHSRRRSRGEAS